MPGSLDRGKEWIRSNLDVERIHEFPYPEFEEILCTLVLECLDSNVENRPTMFRISQQLKIINDRIKIHSTRENEREVLQQEIQDLREKINQIQDRYEDEKSCIVCMVENKRIALKPCGHICLCESCSENPRVEVCPVCRWNIEEKLPVYF